MSGLRAIAAIAALSLGMGLDDPGRFYREPTGPSLPPAPPKPLTKRQKRRLRGKAAPVSPNTSQGTPNEG